jgi:hypothetical protein
MLDYHLERSETLQTHVPVLLAKLGDADRLLEDMRRILTAAGNEGQSVYRVEEAIASLKRLRWCLESKVGHGQDGQTEAILRFFP